LRSRGNLLKFWRVKFKLESLNKCIESLKEESSLRKMFQPKMIHGLFLPKKFFVTHGAATSSVSVLNAFDAALVKAGIAQCNLVNVSSILPPDAELTESVPITPGTITFTVLARMDGAPGETIGAGIGWAWGRSASGEKYGFVAEAHGYKDRQAIERELKWKLKEMAEIRGMKLEKIEVMSEFMEVPKGRYGCVIVALVYVPWTGVEAGRELEERTPTLQKTFPSKLP